MQKPKQKKKTQAQPKPPNPIVDEISIEQQHNVIFKPNEGPQTDFLAAGEREVLYGGSAGGGKSYAMLADPLRFMGHPPFLVCYYGIQQKNLGNLYLNHRKCTLRFGKALSGLNERCSGLRPLVQDCGCPT